MADENERKSRAAEAEIRRRLPALMSSKQRLRAAGFEPTGVVIPSRLNVPYDGDDATDHRATCMGMPVTWSERGDWGMVVRLPAAVFGVGLPPELVEDKGGPNSASAPNDLNEAVRALAEARERQAAYVREIAARGRAAEVAGPPYVVPPAFWDGVVAETKRMESWVPEPNRLDCEYCGRDDVVLYGWHADAWCATCLLEAARAGLRLDGTLEDAPEGRPADADYARPFILQTPDGRIVDGVVQP